MKRILILCTISAAMCIVAFTQTPTPTPENNPEKALAGTTDGFPDTRTLS